MHLQRKDWPNVLTAIMLAGLLVLPACTSREKAAEEMTERMIEKATGGKVDVDLRGQSMKMTTEEGTVSWGEASEWPGDIPGDVPRFTEGKVTGVIRSHAAETKNWSLVLGGVEEGALTRYAETLKADGWEILVSMQMAEGESVSARKGGMTLTLRANRAEKTGTFHVAINPE